MDDGSRSSERETERGSSHSESHDALDDYLPELYTELRRLAHRQLGGERMDHTLCTTALVHEAYLKLAKLEQYEWRNRAQFCAEAARAMRRILIDYAVRRNAKKRGGGRVRVAMRESLSISDADAGRLLDLDAALKELESVRPRHARVVECRFFAGMTIPEVAEALDVSAATVKRDWNLARAWLNRELAQ